jgi:chromosome segregation ATPase
MAATKSTVNIVKFNPDYILEKLYEFDETLGGRMKEEEKEKDKLDPFNIEQNDIIKILKEVQKHQAERNKIKLEEGRNHKMMTLETTINDSMASIEKRFEELVKIRRTQQNDSKFSKEDLAQKDEAINGIKGMIKNIKDREADSKNIKSVKEMAKESGVDIRTIDMSNLQRAEQRNLTKEEKAFLERVEAEREEVNKIMKEVDAGMDKLLQNIDEIGDELNTQGKAIKRLDHKVTKLETNLAKTSKGLKNIVGKFRAATNVVMDIVLIIILMIMIGVLIKVLRQDSNATNAAA